MNEQLNIYEHFNDLVDPRIERGKKHLLVDIIFVAITSILSGADDWNEIEEFGNLKIAWLRKFIKLENGIPSHDTFNRVFSLLDPKKFSELAMELFSSNILEGLDLISIDGKTVRRSADRKNNKFPIHIVSAWSSKNGISLGQVKVDEKSNEITAIPELLSQVKVKNSIVSIDAIGCQKKIVEKIIAQNGDYAIALKGNQPTIYNSVLNYFETQIISGFGRLNVNYSKIEEKAHGRIEKREYWLLTDIDWISQKEEWTGLKSVGMVRSEREYQGKKSIESRYFISSLTNVDLFQKSVRTHWQIENSCHWVLDFAFREDESRIREGYAAENFSIMRKVALNFLKNDTTIKIGVKGKRRAAGWDDDYRSKIIGF
jgi:predicted transposase YbfD/YdcC